MSNGLNWFDNGTTAVTSGQFIPAVFPTGAQETLTAAAPACSLVKYLTDLDAGSNAVAATLADGLVHGQMKKVQSSVVTNATTLTLASAVSTSLDVITFTVIGDYVLLQWDAEGGYWRILERNDEDGDIDTPTVA
jgi:hypothetical protein